MAVRFPPEVRLDRTIFEVVYSHVFASSIFSCPGKNEKIIREVNTIRLNVMPLVDFHREGRITAQKE